LISSFHKFEILKENKEGKNPPQNYY